MTIWNQHPCSVDNVVIPLGDYCYTFRGNPTPIYFCATHWQTNAFQLINQQLQSAGWFSGGSRDLVYDDSVM